MDIVVNVDQQNLIMENVKFAPKTQKFVNFNFKLGSDWDNLKVFAQFTQNGVPYNQYLDENNNAYLPAEITEGECTLMLYGSYDGIVAKTNYITLYLGEDIFVSDGQSTVISQSLYDQLVTEIVNLTNRLNNYEIASVDETNDYLGIGVI